MKLSEAIREGCKYGPKLLRLRHHDDGSSCALGSAENAYQGRPMKFDEMYEQEKDVESIWPWVNKCVVETPNRLGRAHICTAIAWLNNKTDWTREAIAEWVETIERKLGLWDEQPAPEIEAERVAEVEAQYAQDAIHGRPLEID